METEKEESGTRRARIQELANNARHSKDINELIDIHLEMREMQFEIQEKEADARRMFLNSETARKFSEDNTVEHLTDKLGIAVNKAEVKARLTARPLRDAEKMFEAEYKEWEGLRYVTSEFCDAIQQKIATLRKESEVESMRQH